MTAIFTSELGAPVDFWRFLRSSNESPRRLWVVMGQSNAVGTNTGRAPTGIDQMPDNVEIQDADNLIGPFRYPMPFYQANSTTFEPVSGANGNVSPAIAFMQDLARLNTDSRLVVSMCAQSGSSFTGQAAGGGASTNWAAPGSTYKIASNLLDWVIARINSAIGQGCILEGFLWCQGENDAKHLNEAPLSQTASASQVTYSAELLRMIRYLRSGIITPDRYGDHAHKPFLIMEMPRALTGDGGATIPAPGLAAAMTYAWPTAIERAKRAAVMQMPFTCYVESGGLAAAVDNIHWTADSARQMGHRAFGAIEVARRNVSNTTVNSEMGLPSLPRGRYLLPNGRREEVEMGDNLRSAGFQGTAISDSLGAVVNQIWTGTGVGTLFSQPLAFDGSHIVAANFGTGAKAALSLVAVNGSSAPEAVLQVDGLSGVFGEVKIRATPTAITFERNGAVLFTYSLSAGSMENHTSNGPLIMRSQNGSRWELKVTNLGMLTITAI